VKRRVWEFFFFQGTEKYNGELGPAMRSTPLVSLIAALALDPKGRNFFGEWDYVEKHVISGVGQKFLSEDSLLNWDSKDQVRDFSRR